MRVSRFWLSKEVFLGVAFAVLIAVPMFVFGGSKVIYVDKDASSSEDGTASHPYHTISKALKHADDGTEVHIEKGTYRENITIPKGVKIVGDKHDTITIKSDNNDKPAVSMKHDTELDHVTVEGGRHGIRVLEDAGVTIYDVVVKKSKRDGIHIDAASRDKKRRAIIVKTEIKESERAGIYSEKRNLLIEDSYVHENGSDGIDLAMGTKAWFENNRFNDNRGSGAKLVLDGADIWSKKNSFRNNKREGVEINAYGAAGNIGFKKATFVNNGRYGIAQVARTAAATKTFGGVIYGTGVNDNRFEGNVFGNISAIIRAF